MVTQQNTSHTEAAYNDVSARVQLAGSSFYYAMRFLPLAQRRAMYGLYAFCRAVDDISDQDGLSKDQRRKGLDHWRKRVQDVYDGHADHSIMVVLKQAIETYQLPKEELLSLIDGALMDVTTPICAPDWQTLHLYCRRVAGSVGLLSTCIFGDRSKQARHHALCLGEAFQLTNILRDMKEDAGRKRLYLPRELLVKHGISVLQPKTVLASGRLPLICEEVADHAVMLFKRSDVLYQRCRLRALRPARFMCHVYRDILIRLRLRGWDDMSPLPRAGKMKMFSFALRAYLFLR